MHRRYYRTTGGEWLERVDGNPVISIDEAEAHAAAEYGVASVVAVDVPDRGADPRQGARTQPPAQPAPPTDGVTLRVEEVLRAHGLIA